jgi:nucleoside-diphosphate-sugar epimerase
MTRILVTGGTGFIGRAVVAQLLDASADTQVVTLALPGEVIPEGWGARVTPVAGDVTRPDTVSAAMENVDTVIHLAALLGMGSYADHRAVTVSGTRNVLDAALKEQARVVAVSSIAIYGDFVRDRVCTEDVGHGPHYGPYALAKQEQENLVLEYCAEFDLDGCIARPANVFGPGSLPWVGVVCAALKAQMPIVVDGGSGNASLIAVQDVASALVSLAEKGKRGQAYNVSSDLNVSWKQYFSDLAGALGVPLPKSVPYDSLYERARRDEDPEQEITPDAYRSIPLATLALIGSDNRFPNDLIARETGWRPKSSYDSVLSEIRATL